MNKKEVFVNMSKNHIQQDVGDLSFELLFGEEPVSSSSIKEEKDSKKIEKIEKIEKKPVFLNRFKDNHQNSR